MSWVGTYKTASDFKGYRAFGISSLPYALNLEFVTYRVAFAAAANRTLLAPSLVLLGAG